MSAKNKKIKLKTVFSVLWWAVVLLLALLLVNIIGAKMRGEVPKIFGYSVINIVTGSMEDTIPTGSYILIKETDPRKIERGDIICFYSDDPAIYGLPNTHRVKDIIDGESLKFLTRGDANPADDSYPARAERLVGVYVCSLDWLTVFSAALEGRMMFVILIGLQLVTFGVIVLRLFIKPPETESAESADADAGTDTDDTP